MKSREQKLEAKRQAEELMRNPVLKQFFANAEFALFQRWKQAALDPDIADQVRLQYLGLQAFQEFMHNVIVDGRMAERELEEESKNIR